MKEWRMGCYKDDYSVSKSFGRWLKERRFRKGLSLEYSAFVCEIPISRMECLEKGHESYVELSEFEVNNLAKVYGLHPKAIKMRVITG